MFGEARQQGPPATLGRMGEGRSSIWKEGLRPLLHPQSTLTGSTSGDVYIPGLLVLFLGGGMLAKKDAGLNPGQARTFPQVTWWVSTRAGPAPPRQYLEMRQGHFEGHKDT